jgi:hypothetical protein
MYINLAAGLVVLAFSVLLGWLAFRAWRAALPEWGLGILGSL